MNEDDMQALEPSAGDELEQLLARYARVRLDPTPAQTRRARAAVLEAAWRRRLAVDGVPGATRSRDRRPFTRWTPRRIGVSLAAAVFAGLLVGSSTFAASRAGGPLYEARLTIEELTLPSQPDARVDAELAQAQARLAEAVEASGRADSNAVAAALGAYERSVDDVTQASGPSAERVLAAVEFHRTVLEDLLASAPDQALNGLENALTNSTEVIDRLSQALGVPVGAGSGPGGNGGSNTGSNAGGNGGSSAGSNGGGNGGSNGGGNGGSSGGGNGGSNTGGSNAGGNGSGGNGAKPTATPVPVAEPTDRAHPTPQAPGGAGNPPGR
jgi:hypothetical protein